MTSDYRFISVQLEQDIIVVTVTLQRISAVPPIRPGTRAGFGLCMYGGQLTIGLNADPSHFDMATAKQLLDAYVREWRRWFVTPTQESSRRRAA